MAGAKKGIGVRGGDLINMCIEAEAPRCAAFVAADAVLIADDSGVVVMAMGTAEGSPAGYMLLDCIHDVELIIERIRAAADDAFKDQPCTKCDS